MFSDTALARRIEAAEALNSAGSGESIAICGGYATFAGVGSPLTHAIGLGMNGPVNAAQFEAMEHFFRARGVPVNLDFCPHADFSFVELLGAGGYRIVECNNVLVAPVAGSSEARVRMAARNEEPLWTSTMLDGFFPCREHSKIELELGPRLLNLEQASAWFGMSGGRPVSAGAMNARGKLALLFADSTLEPYRGQGLHLALIRARMQHAASLGCDLATASTAPGSVSQRNYERAGFRVVYTKLNMQRDWS
jgi:GNAT superfamily N-acetyltransferase